MIVDSHVHAGWSDTLMHSWDTFEDINVTLGRMDECGIDKAVILPIGHDGFERHNRETAEIVAKHPDRLVGYAKVSQKYDAGRIESLLREAFEKLGLVGLKLHGHPTREIMEVMNHYRKPILADVFGEVYGLRYVAEQYPAVPVIIAHMGEFLSIKGQVRQTTLWLGADVPERVLRYVERERLRVAGAGGIRRPGAQDDLRLGRSRAALRGGDGAGEVPGPARRPGGDGAGRNDRETARHMRDPQGTTGV